MPSLTNFVALIVQAHDVRNAGRHERLVLLGRLGPLDEVEVVALGRNALGLLDGPLADGGDGEPRRQAERLLHGGEPNVPAELVEVDRLADHAADGVDEDQHVRVLGLHHLADIVDRVHQAGAGLVVDQRDGRVLAAGELGVDQFGRAWPGPTRP